MKCKRFFCLALSALMLSACGSSPSGNPAKSRVKIENLPAIINIFSLTAFQTVDNLTDQTALDAWNAYMSDTYGTQIALKTELDLNMSSTLQAVTEGGMTGIVELAPGQIQSFMENEQHKSYILPLEDYLKDNKVWNSLPADFRNRFQRDGHIWAIPKNLANTLKVTSINTNWLKKVGMGLPTSAQELAQAAKLFVEKDANGDGEKNDYLFSTASAVDYNLYSSFGVYLSGYNPNDKYFAHPRTSKGAQDLYAYMQSLYKAGCLDINSFYTERIATNNPQNYATIQGSVGEGKYKTAFELARLQGKTEEELLKDYNEITAGFEALPPFSKDNPVTYSDDGACFVLVDGTKDPGAVVNAFVDILFGFLQSYLDCAYGLPENYSISNNKTIVLNYANQANKTFPLYPGLVNALDIIDSGWIVLTKDMNAELVRRQTEDAKNTRNSILKNTPPKESF